MIHPKKVYFDLLWLWKRGKLRKIERALHRDFDAVFYRTAYPEIAKADLHPLRHYILRGWLEGRDPNALFSTRDYLARYGDIAQAGVNPFYHFVTHGRAEGRIGGFSEAQKGTLEEPAAPLVVPDPPSEAGWAAMPKRVVDDGDPRAVDVIVPVYKGYDHTAACIASVLMAENERAVECLVVNDRSPEAEISGLLRRLAASGHIRLIENEENLGFVESVNRGMAFHPDRDVILLNSDTLVFDGLVDRLARPIERDPAVATVTPLSNNATICSYPDTIKDNNYELEISAERIDKLAARANGDRTVDVPTGVGFCLYIRRAVIDEFGPFDAEIFGTGYGEECDFCMRALKGGWRHVLAIGAYVRHFGSVSFGEEMNERSSQAQRLLAVRHPDYHGRVRRYIAADPSLTGRILLDVARLRESIGPVSVLYVTHSWGGGIETFFENSQVALEEAGLHGLVDSSVILRTHRNGALALEPFAGGSVPYMPNLAALNLERHQALLPALIETLDPQLIHVNSFAGLSYFAIDKLMEAIVRSGRPFWHVWHDHQPLCPRVSFINSEERYCGETDASLCATCLASTGAPLEWVRIDEWRERFRAYLADAERIIAPSEAAAERARRLADPARIEVHRHPEPFLRNVAPIRRARRQGAGTARRVAFLGAIGPHKGANLLQAMIHDANERRLPIHYDVIGYTSLNDIKKSRRIEVHGRYSGDDEAVRKLRRVQPDLMFLSSIWPETYVFTLSVAFALGLPVASFDLGAQGERVRRYGRGVLFDTALMEDPVAVNDALLALDVEALWRRRADGAEGFVMDTPLADRFAPAETKMRAVS